MSCLSLKAGWLLASMLAVALWFPPGSAYGQSRELRDAANKFSTLYSQGHYEEALPFAEKAVKLGEQELGLDHPTFATLLNNLAQLYHGNDDPRFVEVPPDDYRSIRRAILDIDSFHPS